MKYLIFLISTFFILNAEDLQVDSELKTPPQIDDDLILAHSTSKIPKSIILIIADGAGIGQYTLSYYANKNFPFKQFQNVGLVATHPNDGLKKVTDSASSGTAMATGEKTYNGAISVDVNGTPIKTVLEIAHELGMGTGVVATSTVTHATPASFLAHIDYRKKEGEIARQMAKSNADVILGGGREFWTDNVISILEENDGQLITKLNQSYDPSKRIVGLFEESALRPHYEGRTPTTTQMAEKALNILDNNTGGFFLMVEESQVDWGGHSNNPDYIKGEMESLSDLVEMCLDYQRENPNVLVVLTADHECGGVAVHDAKDGNLDIQFTSDYHSANFVPIWATGPGSDFFDAMIDNTMIGKQLIKYVKNR